MRLLASGKLLERGKFKANGKKLSLVHAYTPARSRFEHDETYELDYLLSGFADLKCEPLREVAYEDTGLLGDVQFRIFLDAPTGVVNDVRNIGTDIFGVSLKKLTDAQTKERPS
ncbi:uncharacterized protein A1O9_08119 [Exophiala aquamarina CBS 119918]|uniref:Uncharacterized protein n=1 Tax=Exophiala aquamarina CBS 119918 TaxID=1182545 RepID=A0A072P5L1_9EURO|nr:uncharacterized protein A1O9_08119 [Exophiala aquamarina CBS 119918]KEF55369.1 hypothetical protein A1O9_08119 [Exophiala aquamarina CBS 119918]